MQHFSPFLFCLFVGFLLFLGGCQDRVVDKLRPETVEFLTNQESARCTCLDMYGDEFYKKTNKGLDYINSLEGKYNLDSLTLSQTYEIKLELVGFMSIIKTVSECIAEKTPQMDQLMGMMVQYDLKQVLQIDSTMSQEKQMEMMNVPSMEILDDLCSKHRPSVDQLNELIKAAQILPPGLQ